MGDVPVRYSVRAEDRVHSRPTCGLATPGQCTPLVIGVFGL